LHRARCCKSRADWPKSHTSEVGDERRYKESQNWDLGQAESMISPAQVHEYKSSLPNLNQFNQKFIPE
jgi:hypothetical protein